MLFAHLQDLASQFYYWDRYKKACRLANKTRGKIINPTVAEYLVGT